LSHIWRFVDLEELYILRAVKVLAMYCEIFEVSGTVEVVLTVCQAARTWRVPKGALAFMGIKKWLSVAICKVFPFAR